MNRGAWQLQSRRSQGVRYDWATVVIKSLSHVQLFVVPWTAIRQPPLSFTISQSLLKFMSLSHWCYRTISSSSPLLLLLSVFSYHQGLFQWASSSHQVAKLLELQFQHQSFQWIFRVDFLWEWPVWFPCRPRDSQESPAPQFKSISSSAYNLLYGSHTHTWLLGKP